MRGMGFFHDASFEPAKRQALRGIPGQIAGLKILVADNPAQEATLRDLSTAMTEYLSWADTVNREADAGQWAQVDKGLDILYGKHHVDKVQVLLQKFLQAEERLDTQRLATALQSRQYQRTALLTVAGLTVLLAAGLLWAFTRSVGLRLAVATENAKRLADDESLADPVAGSDEIARLDAVLHDTARRLRAAAANEAHYREELQRRAEELERTNQDLIYKTQENETFVYSVSHDLRSPLVNLQGFARELTHACTELREVLESATLPSDVHGRVGTIIDEDILTSIHFIETAVTRSSNIIDALLRLSRAGRVEYQSQDVDLNPIIERIVAAMRVTLDEKKAQVHARPLPAVRADPTAIEQVFANLIANAVNYLDPNRPGRIEVGVAGEADQAADRVTLFVRDNGLGIPAAYLPKLFVAFQRLHGNIAPGEGIGLALVKRIVDRHGGRIWAESTEGVGTVFYVSLVKAGTLEESLSADDAGRAVVSQENRI